MLNVEKRFVCRTINYYRWRLSNLNQLTDKFYPMHPINIYFTKIIKLENRLREINFRKLPNTDNNYHVDVTDDKGNRIIFSMYRDAEGKWKTSAQKLPIWIHNAELVLGEVIEKHLKEQKAIK